MYGLAVPLLAPVDRRRKKLHTRSNEKVVERSTTPDVVASPRVTGHVSSRFTRLLFQQKRSGLLLFAIETDKAEYSAVSVGGRARYVHAETS